MNIRSLTLLAIALSSISLSCAESNAASSVASTQAVASGDPAITPYRSHLLDLAYDAASAFPIHPHVKNRSRAQEAVVTASLELGQTQRALRQAAGIANWRRGKCYADVAYALAERGERARVQEYLDLATAIADGGGLEPAGTDVEGPQEWHGDRIRASVAATYVLLGQEERAARASEGAVESETNAIHVERARRSDPARFDERVAALDALVAAGSFESLRAALDAYAELYGRHYDDAERRDLVAARIESAWTKLPIQVRVDVQAKLVAHAIDRGDEARALASVESADALLATTKWTAEGNVPLAARIAGLRARAGDRKGAIERLDAVLARYEAERETVVNVYRAGVLRPVAEAYAAAGEEDRARAVYARAIEEGVVNPNSRPRAEDLAATAASMAVHDVEPDERLVARMEEIRAGLGDPW